ncbi:CdaR family transcriptional regulator [Aquisalibacillus elongatus]|uniref:CdaR family transcriptional regulator n=1 Tax=Aquisalibacillus elongatus TaxID=485577 RepID=A0A3N5B6Z6_9BACI|nr:sugar diacid recognition domain-containing protein [Aquisalibacillus elongatus]RPF53204.1 CdaR family transcriptional regulator [Aquisalibacillus elongatus]
MELTKQLANEVIERLAGDIDFSINIMDKAGLILASTNENRVGEVHAGAQSVLNTLTTVIIDQDNVEEFPNSKPGVNVPVYLNQEVIGVVGITGEPDEVLPIAKVFKVTVEMVIEQIYHERQYFYQEQLLQNWLQKLLHPLMIDEKEVFKQGQRIVEFEETQSYQVLVFQSENINLYLDQIKRAISAVADPLFTTMLQNEEVISCVPQTISNEMIKSFEKLNLDRIGIGTFERGLMGIRKSYFYAKDAMKLITSQNIASVTDYTLEVLTSKLPEDVIQDFYQKELDQLKFLSSDYHKTIKTFVAYDFQMNQTADKLHIHRNTLNYRLDMVSQIVGLDPKKAKDLFVLWLLLNQLGCANDQ